MSSNEERLDQFIDAMHAGRADSGNAGDTELAGLFDTTRQLHALRVSAAPAPDFPSKLATRLSAQLRPATNGHRSSLDWVRHSTHSDDVPEKFYGAANPWTRESSISDDDEKSSWVRQTAQIAGAAAAFTAFAFVLVLVFRGVGGDGFPTVNAPDNSLPAGASTDMQQIAFTGVENGDEDIYLINADGSDLVNLTDNPGGDGAPTWSPDGSRTAFVSHRDGQAEIYVMDADGSNVRRLTDNPTSDVGPAWSPDGQKIAFVREVSEDNERSVSIYVMNADGSSQQALTSGWNILSAVAWSPDSSMVAVALSTNTTEHDVRLIDTATGDVTTLIDSAASPHGSLSWSADGERLAVMTYTTDGVPQVYTMNIYGVDMRTPSTESDIQLFPSWSPVGHELLFVGQQDGAQGIYVADMSDEGSTRLITATDGARYLWPAWSSNAQKIAFVRTQSSNNDEVQDTYQLMTVNADGSGLTSLSSDLVTDSFALPAWRPTTSSTPVEAEPTAEIEPTPTALSSYESAVQTVEVTPNAVAQNPTVVPNESTTPGTDHVTLDEAIEIVRDFLGDPDAPLTGQLHEVVPGEVFYQIVRPIDGSIDLDSVSVDAQSGAILGANLPSNTTLYGPAKSITESDARDIAEIYAAELAPRFGELDLYEESTRGAAPGQDGEDGLYTISWQLRASDDGAWLPTHIVVGIDLDTGLLYSFDAVDQPYDGPTEPIISEEEAVEIALDHARQDPQTLPDVSVSKVKLRVMPALPEISDDNPVAPPELRLTWLVVLNGALVDLMVDALTGEILNPFGAPAG